jgi:predicted nucleotidyltransferase
MGIRDKIMGVKLGFITPTMMQVFEFFLENNLNEYYEREIVRKTGVSKGSAGKILKMLTKLGFLTREEKGRLTIYKLNQNEAVVKQFKILINTFALKPLTDMLKEVSKRIVLFGSCSQGTDTKESDIDILVVTNEKDIVAQIISGFNRKNERRVAPITVDFNEYVLLKKDDKPLYENIERGIVLWETE